MSSAIAQHYIYYPLISFFEIEIVAVPAAVATAVIPLNLPAQTPEYLNITFEASRLSGLGTDTIPVDNPYYNVAWSAADFPPPYLFQTISSDDTRLYITLPPQPGTAAISLTIPNDGSPPPFDALYTAMQTALQNNPFLDTLTSNTIPALTATTTSPSPSKTSTLTFSAADVSRIAAELGTGSTIGGLYVSGTSSIANRGKLHWKADRDRSNGLLARIEFFEAMLDARIRQRQYQRPHGIDRMCLLRAACLRSGHRKPGRGAGFESATFRL